MLGQRPLDADTAVNNFGKIISDMLRTMVQEEGEPMLETVATMRSRWVQEEQCKKSKSRPCDCAKIRNQCDRIKKTVLQMEFVLVNEHPDGISWLLLRMKHEMRCYDLRSRRLVSCRLRLRSGASRRLIVPITQPRH